MHRQIINIPQDIKTHLDKYPNKTKYITELIRADMVEQQEFKQKLETLNLPDDLKERIKKATL